MRVFKVFEHAWTGSHCCERLTYWFIVPVSFRRPYLLLKGSQGQCLPQLLSHNWMGRAGIVPAKYWRNRNSFQIVGLFFLQIFSFIFTPKNKCLKKLIKLSLFVIVSYKTVIGIQPFLHHRPALHFTNYNHFLCWNLMTIMIRIFNETFESIKLMHNVVFYKILLCMKSQQMPNISSK